MLRIVVHNALVQPIRDEVYVCPKRVGEWVALNLKWRKLNALGLRLLAHPNGS